VKFDPAAFEGFTFENLSKIKENMLSKTGM